MILKWVKVSNLQFNLILTTCTPLQFKIIQQCHIQKLSSHILIIIDPKRTTCGVNFSNTIFCLIMFRWSKPPLKITQQHHSQKLTCKTCILIISDPRTINCAKLSHPEFRLVQTRWSPLCWWTSNLGFSQASLLAPQDGGDGKGF